MADKAHRLTDEKLEEMEKRLSAIYSRAEKEIRQTADEYFSKFAKQDEAKRKLLEQGKILFIYFIPLQAVGIEPGDGDLRPKEIEGGEERRVGIVALDPGVNGMVVLTAGDEKGFFILPPNRYAELGERLDGQIDVGAAFDRRNELDGAALRHQREDEKEPGNKLAADVAFDLEAAAFQPAADGDALRGGLKKESLLFADLLVDAHGAGKKGRAAGEGDPAAAQKAEGDEKAQRAAAFAAVQNRLFRLNAR